MVGATQRADAAANGNRSKARHVADCHDINATARPVQLHRLEAAAHAVRAVEVPRAGAVVAEVEVTCPTRPARDVKRPEIGVRCPCVIGSWRVFRCARDIANQLPVCATPCIRNHRAVIGQSGLVGRATRQGSNQRQADHRAPAATEERSRPHHQDHGEPTRRAVARSRAARSGRWLIGGRRRSGIARPFRITLQGATVERLAAALARTGVGLDDRLEGVTGVPRSIVVAICLVGVRLRRTVVSVISHAVFIKVSNALARRLGPAVVATLHKAACAAAVAGQTVAVVAALRLANLAIAAAAIAEVANPARAAAAAAVFLRGPVDAADGGPLDLTAHAPKSWIAVAAAAVDRLAMLAAVGGRQGAVVVVAPRRTGAERHRLARGVGAGHADILPVAGDEAGAAQTGYDDLDGSAAALARTGIGIGTRTGIRIETRTGARTGARALARTVNSRRTQNAGIAEGTLRTGRSREGGIADA